MQCLACHADNIDGARFCAVCGAPLPAKTEEQDPLIGKTVGGRYRVAGVLGEGGMGRVYNAEQQMGTSVRRVAVKTLLAQFAKDPQTVARFMREVGTVSELEHPNTIKVYDFGQIEGSGELYIAMELLQGQALEDALASGQPMAPERVDRIVGQVCGSLQEAHDKGIVHRDLKPANIFLTTRAGEEDVVKVLDFGIAKRDGKDSKQEQKLTQQGTILGTPPYMSPEQFTGKELDNRSDIYSLAILVYEMLTGRLPFEADTPWQWMTQHMQAQPYPFESTAGAATIPTKMRQAILHALEKDPAKRPSTVREFFEEFTIGATRMSVVGLGAGGIAGIPSMPTTSVGAARPGGTQIGEPLFAPGPPAGAPGGASPTVIGDMPVPTLPAGGGFVGAAPAPTAAPAPRPAPASSGPSLAVIGAIAFVVIAGGLGAFFVLKKGGDEGEDASIPVPAKTSKSRDDGDASSSSSSSASTSGGSETQPTAAPSASDGGATPPPTSAPTSTTTSAPTPTTAPTTKPTATATTTATAAGGGGGAAINTACCASIKDKGSRQTCQAVLSGYNANPAGRNRAAVLATVNRNGANCR